MTPTTDVALDLDALADEQALLLITVRRHDPNATGLTIQVLTGSRTGTVDTLVDQPSLRLSLRDMLPGTRVLTRIERRGQHRLPCLVGARPGDLDLIPEQ